MLLADKSRLFVFAVCVTPYFSTIIIDFESRVLSFIPQIPVVIWWTECFFGLNRSIGNQFETYFVKSFIVTFILLNAVVIVIDSESTVEAMHFVDALVLTLIVLHSFLGLYTLWVLTRVYKIATTGKDPNDWNLLPEFIRFAAFPFGIWMYQQHIQRLIVETKMTNHGKNNARP